MENDRKVEKEERKDCKSKFTVDCRGGFIGEWCVTVAVQEIFAEHKSWWKNIITIYLRPEKPT
jgi:hypothetical protein